MKRLTKQLLDDLLDDSVPPEFRAALMKKILRSARQRQRVRHFSLILAAVGLIGIFAFQEMHEPGVSLDQIRRPISGMTMSPTLNRVNMVSTKPDALKNIIVSDSADSTLKVVQTSELNRPREINDQELLALAADKPMVLIHQGPHQSELFFSNVKVEREVPIR